MASTEDGTLVTERLEFRPVRADHLAGLRDLIDYDPAVVWDPLPLTADESAARHASRVDNWSRGWGMWTVFDGTTGDMLGRCGFQVLEDTGEVELGYFLGQRVWGRGLATEAVEAVLGWADDHVEAETIVAAVRADNLASQRVLTKAGFRFETVAEYHGEEVQRWTRRRGAER